MQVCSVISDPVHVMQCRAYKTQATCLQCAVGPWPAPHSHCASCTTSMLSSDKSTLYDTDFFISAHTEAEKYVILPDLDSRTNLMYLHKTSYFYV